MNTSSATTTAEDMNGTPTPKIPALQVWGLSAGYGSLVVVRDVSLTVAHGEIVAILGRNGAGKTTTLMAIGGFLGRYSGQVLIDGEPLRGPAFRRSREQIGLVLEGRSVFPSLTVRQNLDLAKADVEEALTLFPEMKEKLSLKAGLLSGGEQQMLALARAVGRHPRVLLIDELSFGLAPVLCERMFERLRQIVAASSLGVLLVEQHIHYAESVADRALVMNEGSIRAEIPSSEMIAREAEIERIYLGGVDPGRA